MKEGMHGCLQLLNDHGLRCQIRRWNQEKEVNDGENLGKVQKEALLTKNKNQGPQELTSDC